MQHGRILGILHRQIKDLPLCNRSQIGCPLRAWYTEMKRANWSGPQAIKTAYSTASILRNNRVVFNIMVNTYRLVVPSSTNFRWFISASLAPMRSTTKSKQRSDMTIKPIKTERDHQKALKEIEKLWDARPNTAQDRASRSD